MIKIMFVCHGNICRSPMAEFIFKALIDKQGLSDEFVVESAATSAEEIWNGIGNPVYPPAKAELEKHGIHCENKRARLVEKDDYSRFDLLVCMDNNNVRNLMRIIKHDNDNKVHLLMDYTSQVGEVSDPWYSGRFDVAFNDIMLGCKSLLEQIK